MFNTDNCGTVCLLLTILKSDKSMSRIWRILNLKPIICIITYFYLIKLLVNKSYYFFRFCRDYLLHKNIII